MDDYGQQFEKFTENAKRSLIAAQRIAREVASDEISTDHMLLGVLKVPQSLGAAILESVGLVWDKANLLYSFSKKLGNGKSRKGISEEAEQAINLSVLLAKEFGQPYVGTEHLLLACLNQEDSKANQLLRNFKIDPAIIRAELEHYLSNSSFFEPIGQMQKTEGKGAANSKTPALDSFSIDLTNAARENKLDPVVGREKEIARVISILNRRTKNNPVLIGEPGVGKTAIAEGLAQRVIHGDVPEMLQNKRILMLDLASVIAGTKYRGEFEERLKKVLEEAKADKTVILFIDELHTVVGAGAAEGAMDAANILKPSLSRGEIQVIGATTMDEYRKHIEKDAALERRFQPVIVPEATEEETLAVLTGIRQRYEEFHKVKISDEALQAAAKMAKRYVSDRFLPDKAIDLIDEAASLKRIRAGGTGKNQQELTKELDSLQEEKERAVLSQDYEYAARLRTREITLEEKIGEIKGTPGQKELVLTEKDIAEVIAMMTGIPATRLIKTESESLIKLEDTLKARIISQEEAVHEVSSAIRRARTGIGDQKRPIGSFIFLGPTGVGKTELAKQLAKEVFGSEEAIVKIDMSEFMEKHNVSRLVGAPPGYVGYEESGKLTETIRRKPYSVLLFDEIEKAHPDVFNMLLQILEEGVLTDSKGRKVDFKNAIIIMTSNVGAHDLAKVGALGFKATGDEKKNVTDKYSEMKLKLMDDLKNSFRPEFLNRVDRIVIFKPLDKHAMRSIVNIQLEDLAKRVESEQKMSLKYADTAKEFLVEKGYDPDYGARPLRRVIQNMIEDPLANGILEGEFKEGDTVSVIKKGSTISLFLLDVGKKKAPVKK